MCWYCLWHTLIASCQAACRLCPHVVVGYVGGDPPLRCHSVLMCRVGCLHLMHVYANFQGTWMCHSRVCSWVCRYCLYLSAIYTSLCLGSVERIQTHCPSLSPYEKSFVSCGCKQMCVHTEEALSLTCSALKFTVARCALFRSLVAAWHMQHGA
jgi:hypothetical protein